MYEGKDFQCKIFVHMEAIPSAYNSYEPASNSCGFAQDPLAA